MKRNDMHTVHIPTVISACCILHNICEIHGECFNDTWLLNETEFKQPTSASLCSTSSTENARMYETLSCCIYIHSSEHLL